MALCVLFKRQVLDCENDCSNYLCFQLRLCSASAPRSSRKRWPLSAWSREARPSSARTPWTKPPTSETPCPRPCTDASSAGSSTASTRCCSPTWRSGESACRSVKMSTLPLLIVSDAGEEPLKSPADLCGRLQRRMQRCRGEYQWVLTRQAKEEQKKKKEEVLINFWYRVACGENNVQMIKKTSERLQRGSSLIQKNSFINMSIECQRVVSQKWGEARVPV